MLNFNNFGVFLKKKSFFFWGGGAGGGVKILWKCLMYITFTELKKFRLTFQVCISISIERERVIFKCTYA